MKWNHHKISFVYTSVDRISLIKFKAFDHHYYNYYMIESILSVTDLRTHLITPSISELATHVPVQLNLQWVMNELCSEYFS